MTYESRRDGSLLLLTLSIIAEKYIYSKASVLSSEYLMTNIACNKDDAGWR